MLTKKKTRKKKKKQPKGEAHGATAAPAGRRRRTGKEKDNCVERNRSVDPEKFQTEHGNCAKKSLNPEPQSKRTHSRKKSVNSCKEQADKNREEGGIYSTLSSGERLLTSAGGKPVELRGKKKHST